MHTANDILSLYKSVISSLNLAGQKEADRFTVSNSWYRRSGAQCNDLAKLHSQNN